jgi:hypothetical protein
MDSGKEDGGKGGRTHYDKSPLSSERSRRESRAAAPLSGRASDARGKLVKELGQLRPVARRVPLREIDGLNLPKAKGWRHGLDEHGYEQAALGAIFGFVDHPPGAYRSRGPQDDDDPRHRELSLDDLAILPTVGDVGVPTDGPTSAFDLRREVARPGLVLRPSLVADEYVAHLPLPP